MLNSTFFNNIMLREIQSLIEDINKISQIKDFSFKSTILMDEKNQILHNITKNIIEVKIEDNDLATREIKREILEKLVDSIVPEESIRNELVQYNYEDKLFRLREILKKSDSNQLKTYVFEKIITIILKLLKDDRAYSNPPNFAEDFISVWKNYFTTEFFLNPSIIIRSSIDEYAVEFNKKILTATKESIIHKLKEDKVIMVSHTFISQISRIYVDLAFHLIILYRDIKTLFNINIKKFCEIIFEEYVKFVEDLENPKLNIDLRYIIGCPIIMGSLFLNSIDDFENFIINKTLKSQIGILIAFGIKVCIKENLNENFNITKLDKIFSENKEKIKKFFTVDSFSESDMEIFITSIFTLGFTDDIGTILLDMLEVFNNQEIIKKYVEEIDK